MERSEWQIAAEASRFDGGRDRRRDEGQATIEDLRREEARQLAALEARRRIAREMGMDLEAIPGPDGPGVERDWAGNVVRRPVRRVDAELGARTNLVPGMVPSREARVLGSDFVPEEAHGRKRFGREDVRFSSYSGAIAPKGGAEEAAAAAAAASGSALSSQVTFQTAPGAETSDAWRSVNRGQLDGGGTESWQRNVRLPAKKAVPDPHGLEAFRRGESSSDSFGQVTASRHEDRGRAAAPTDMLTSIASSLASQLPSAPAPRRDGVARLLAGGTTAPPEQYRSAQDEAYARSRLAEEAYKKELERLEQRDARIKQGIPVHDEEAPPLPTGYTGKLSAAPVAKTTRDRYFRRI